MKKRSIGLIIGLMLFALLGVIAMQYYFIRQSYDLKSQLFDEAVNAALNTVVLKAEKKEAIDFIEAQELKDKQNKWLREQQRRQIAAIEGMRRKQMDLEATFREQEFLLLKQYPGAINISNTFYETYIRDPKFRNQVKLKVFPSGEGLYQNKQLELYAEKIAEKEKRAKDDSVRYVVVDDYYRGWTVVTLPPKRNRFWDEQIRKYEEQDKIKQASRFFDSFLTDTDGSPAKVMENLANDFELAKKPLKSRVNLDYIIRELREELRLRNISLPFNLFITEGTDDSVLFQSATYNTAFNKHDAYSTLLFPNNMIKSSGKVFVLFPTKHFVLSGNMGPKLISSAGLLLVLIGCFAYTIFSILKQKKISEMKTDFINNMTHEFKTPVSTIMIASESLKDPEIISDKNRVLRLANIIYDENVRLGNHIERVLNIARVDKGDLKMEQREVNMNDLVSAVVDSMELQLKKREAKVTVNTQATNPVVFGDELHLSNVIFNLIDNAIKYSKEVPEIMIKTKNVNGYLHIEVVDKGIGMSRDQLSRIFEQFYRVSTGNVHDVKGFGLGLSYVQDVIKRMKGSIKVKSERNKGTEFDIALPILVRS